MEGMHPLTKDPIPVFIAAPGQTDVLFTIAMIFFLGLIFAVGILYLRLHALPEHIAHRGNKIQLEIVALLGLIALFTHNHLFWIAGLLLAFIEIPDLSSPITSIARSLEKIAGSKSGAGTPTPAAEDDSGPPPPDNKPVHGHSERKE